MELVDEAVQNLRQAAARLSEIGGLTGGYLLVDPDEGTLISLTVWEDRAALDAGRTRATALRQEAVRPTGGSVVSVVEYSVAGEFQPSPRLSDS